MKSIILTMFKSSRLTLKSKNKIQSIKLCIRCFNVFFRYRSRMVHKTCIT